MARGDESYRDLLAFQSKMHELVKTAAPHAEAVLASPQGDAARRNTWSRTSSTSRTELLADQMLGMASCAAALPLIDHALREDYSLDAEKITCPVRVLWGAEDRLLPLPSAAARFRHDWLPQADWVELDGVGHCPQLDIPLETAQLILGLTSR